jgi:hypothetical protein
MVGPPIMIAWILYVTLPSRITGKKRYWLSILLLLTPILTLSRTTIIGSVAIGFIISLVYVYSLYTHQDLLTFAVKSLGLSAMIGISISILVEIMFRGVISGALATVLGFLYSGITGGSPGAQRHWLYLTLIPNSLSYTWESLIFGYSNVNTGVSMELVGEDVLPGISTVSGGTWNPESSFVVYALMGGGPGLLAWAIYYLGTIIQSIRLTISGTINKKIGITSFISMNSIIVFMIGYNMVSTWYYVIQPIILIWVWSTKEETTVMKKNVNDSQIPNR